MGPPLRDLALRSWPDATSATRLVDQLEQANLPERKRNDTDRGSGRVWLHRIGNLWDGKTH
jgi:DNA-binding MarR family transcriptional regulator